MSFLLVRRNVFFIGGEEKNEDELLIFGVENCDEYLIGGVDYEFCKHKAQVHLSPQFCVHINVDLFIHVFKQSCLVWLWWGKTGKSNRFVIFVFESNETRSRANNNRVVKQSWAGEVSKANEPAVEFCKIRDWFELTRRLVVYPQNSIILKGFLQAESRLSKQ